MRDGREAAVVPWSFYPRGNRNLNLCQMYKTRIAPMMDTINPPR
jgi:hypothetical protein